MWKQQISQAIRFFKVRITGPNEGLNSQVEVLLHSFRYGGRITDQRCGGASAHEAHACPEIGTYFQFFAPAVMQLRHAALSFRVEPCECFLRSGDRVVIEVANQIIRGSPGFSAAVAGHHESGGSVEFSQYTI